MPSRFLVGAWLAAAAAQPVPLPAQQAQPQHHGARHAPAAATFPPATSGIPPDGATAPLLGSAVLERPIVDVLALPPMLRSPVLLGTKALQHFAVTLDQRQRLVRLERKVVGPVAAPPPLRSFGLSAPHAEDGLRRIYHVLPGSPADREGVQAGDEIVSADGRSAGELSEAELAGLGHLGRPVRFRLRRDGVEREVTLASFVQVD